jgi:hypothetical protein
MLTNTTYAAVVISKGVLICLVPGLSAAAKWRQLEVHANPHSTPHKTHSTTHKTHSTTHNTHSTPHNTHTAHHPMHTAHRTMHTLWSFLCRFACSNPISILTSPMDRSQPTAARSVAPDQQTSAVHIVPPTILLLSQYIRGTVQPGVAIKDNKTAEGVDNTIARFMAWRARGTS